MLLLHPSYLVATAVLGGWRVSVVSQESGDRETYQNMERLWGSALYVAMVMGHKLLATAYYVANIRATIALGDPIYYSKSNWGPGR